MTDCTYIIEQNLSNSKIQVSLVETKVCDAFISKRWRSEKTFPIVNMMKLMSVPRRIKFGRIIATFYSVSPMRMHLHF